MPEVNENAADIGADEIADESGFLPEQDAAGDGTDGIVVPPDHPLAVTDFGTTERETLEGESLDGRLARELPDETPSSPAGEDVPAGRLVDTDDGAYADTEKDAVAYDAGADSGGMSAEEAAMHVIPE